MKGHDRRDVALDDLVERGEHADLSGDQEDLAADRAGEIFVVLNERNKANLSQLNCPAGEDSRSP